ncbi:hypothetical protein AAMO2058_001205600 [Amorphochlora amoebiformis]
MKRFIFSAVIAICLCANLLLPLRTANVGGGIAAKIGGKNIRAGVWGRCSRGNSFSAREVGGEMRMRRLGVIRPRGYGGENLGYESYEDDLKEALKQGTEEGKETLRELAELNRIVEPLYGDDALAAIRAEKDMWIFTYGSDMYDPGFEVDEKREGWVKGFVRRFYAISTKKHGTPEAPGRTLTMVRDPGAWIWGYLMKVSEDDKEKVLTYMAENADPGEIPQVVEMGYAKSSSTEGGGIFGGKALSYVMDPKSEFYGKTDNSTTIARDVVMGVGEKGSGAGHLLGIFNTMGEISGFDRTEGFEIDHHVDDVVEALPKTWRQERGFALKKTRLKREAFVPKTRTPAVTTYNA